MVLGSLSLTQSISKTSMLFMTCVDNFEPEAPDSWYHESAIFSVIKKIILDYGEVVLYGRCKFPHLKVLCGSLLYEREPPRRYRGRCEMVLWYLLTDLTVHVPGRPRGYPLSLGWECCWVWSMWPIQRHLRSLLCHGKLFIYMKNFSLFVWNWQDI